ncbi:MAG: thiopeptide-type bacteriocin biosynthesis protein [Gemmatimonadetes bacterium]|nr:thiopeptide-type bacteriocin biosynthesis protein [Gemmatimonadota bacterium]
MRTPGSKPWSETGERWLSGHLFYGPHAHPESGDRILLDVVGPFVRRSLERGWISRYFFIRYGELGPHLRLRLCGEARVLEEEVGPALEEQVGSVLSAELRGSPRGELPEGAVRSPVEALVWIPYHPEVARYGGPEGVRLAEEFFFRSSEAVLDCLRRLVPGDRAQRLGITLMAQVAALGAFTRDPAEAALLASRLRDEFSAVARPDGGGAELRRRFDEGYERQAAALGGRVEAVWEAVGEGAELPAPMDGYLAATTALRDGIHALLRERRLRPGGAAVEGREEAHRALVPSYVHMNNNRMGVSNNEESFLSHIVQRTLERSTAAAS